MFSCRAAWQRCGPLARRAAYRLPLDVQRRPMSSVPGGSGENIVYALLCGGAFVGAVSYAYSTVTSDGARFNERIAEIQARPKTEWTPKPWPPKSPDDAEGEEEEEAAAEEATEEVAVVEEEAPAASDGEAEAIVEAIAEAVAEAAEVVAEAAEEVAEAAQEVETVAEEVAEVAETVEEAAQAIAAEEPEHNVLLAAASTLEIPKILDEKEDDAHEILASPEAKPPEEIAPRDDASKPIEEKESAAVEDMPAPVEAEPVAEDAPAPAEAEPVAEDAPSPVEAEAEPVAEDVPAPVETEAEPVGEDVPAPVETEAEPVGEDVPAPVEAEPVAEDAPAPVEAEAEPVAEDAPVSVEAEAEPVAEDAPAPVEAEAEPVAEDAPAPVEAESVSEAALVPEEAEAVVQESQECFVPDVCAAEVVETNASESGVLVEESLGLVGGEGEDIKLSAEVSPNAEVLLVTPDATAPNTEGVDPTLNDPVCVETTAGEPKKEYIVVVLEGKPKTEKKPKVLGVGTMTGRIIPAPDDVPASEDKRRLLRMQMQ
ncbi:skin secretory protein xP2 isoform X2 [Takifugu rubripes]|uniref:skin secretory protein xP2 isoform X2 n=1 Tax=Takifugu rubripes TaxID=31033 RepID=UPI0011460BCC|nr:protein MGARP isoform X2 [Takifugu rubripes]